MNSHGFRSWFGALALAALSAWALSPAGASAQTFSADAGVVPAVVRDASPKGNEIQPVGCSSCGSGLFGSSLTDGLGGGSSCGSGGCGRKDTCTPCGPEQCYAGKKPCDCCWEPHTHFGAVIKGVYNCICCNDPCYEPKWVALANASFLLDSPRPVTHMKIGGDFVWDLRKPDKAELFWARVNRRGPAGGAPLGGGNAAGERALDYTDAYLYNETAPTPGFGIFVYLPIRHVDPASYPTGSGFADMVVGTKSVILDCELLLATFMFKTFIPTGSSNKGLGTGHVSLEPSLTAALKLTPYSFLQGQIGYRFPLGGDDEIQGSLLYAGLSYNHLLWNCGKDIQLIGTLEGYLACAQNGLFTDEFTGLPLSANQLGAFFNAGPGVRLVVCEKVDIGVATSIQLTEDGTIGDLVRVEFRWRF